MSNITEKERIAQLEVLTTENIKDISKLREEASAFYRIAVNQEMLTNTLNELVKDNKEQMKDFSNTLSVVNLNLSNLNHNQENLRTAVDQVNSRVDGAIGQLNTRVDEIQDGLEREVARDTISISDNLKKWFGWILFTLPTMILGALLLYYLGLN